MNFRRAGGFVLFSVITALTMYACGGGGGGGGSAAPETPTVSTSAAVPGIENATLIGTVNPHGLATLAWFEYGTDPNLVGASSTINSKKSAGDNTATVGVSSLVTGLEIWKDYYYRVVAENSAGQPVKGSIVPFKTVAPTPAATTGVADNLGSNGTIATARINGSVDPKGLATTPVFEWGTTEDLSGAFTIPFAAKTGKGNQSISADLTSLSLNTDYWFRVVTTNTAGIVTQGKTVKFRTLPNPLPIADAGTDNTIGPANISVNAGAITGRLDGSRSADVAGGTITSYLWEQIGTPAVIISPSNSQIATFIAPASIPYPALDLNFKLTVTSSRLGLTNSDTTKVTVKWGLLDDFTTDTTVWFSNGPGTPPANTIPGYYAVTNGGYIVRVYAIVDPGVIVVPVVGEGMNYVPALQLAEAKASNNHGVVITREIPSSDKGIYSMDFYPIQNFGEGAGFTLRLAQDANNYYEISNWFDDGSEFVGTPTIKKVVAGTTVASQVYPNRYLQNGGTFSYPIKVSFSPTLVTWEAFGFTYVYSDPTPGGRSIPVSTVSMDFWQQDAFIDNVRVESLP